MQKTFPFLNIQDVSWKAVRSGGPGGQRLNKRSTKVQMWVKIEELPFSDGEKERIRDKLAGRIDQNDELQVESEEERFQGRNKELALEKLNLLIRDALRENPKRIPTNSPPRAEEERLRHKHARYQKKKSRREAKSSDVEEDL